MPRGRPCVPPLQAESEIRRLLDQLHQQAAIANFSGSAARDRDPASLLPRSSQKDKAVYDYVTTTNALQVSGAAGGLCGSRPLDR